jgi:hypothetical protein
VAGLDLLDADAGPLAALERELLELPQQALATLADLRHERLRGGAVELDAELGRLRHGPARELLRLRGRLLADVAPRLLHRRGELRRSLLAPVLAGEERNRGVGREGGQRGPDRVHHV